MMRVHIDGTRRVLQEMHAAGVRRMILASTSGTVAVSRHEEILDEEAGYATEVVAGWPYYASKIYQEKLAFALGTELGVEVVSINPACCSGRAIGASRRPPT
jgi:dihydroflavonol-4-reductase